MKFTSVSVLILGATFTGVLAAPILKGGDIANVAAANMEKREAAAQPDQIQNGIFEIGLAAVGDPYWCGAPSCGKEKREAVAEPEALAQPDRIQNDIFDIGLAASHDPYWCGTPFCDKEKREAVASPGTAAEPLAEAIASPVADAEVKLVKRPMGPPPGFPHPKCGKNLCQPYAHTISPLLTRATHAIKRFLKRQFGCGAPFCSDEGKA